MLENATQSALNLNIDSKTLDSCLKTINNIGSTTYQNICTGQSVVVPLGSLDLLCSIFALVSMGFLLMLFVWIFIN